MYNILKALIETILDVIVPKLNFFTTLKLMAKVKPVSYGKLISRGFLRRKHEMVGESVWR